MVFGLVNRPPESPWEGEAMVTHTRKATAGGEALDALLGEGRDLLRAPPLPCPLSRKGRGERKAAPTPPSRLTRETTPLHRASPADAR